MNRKNIEKIINGETKNITVCGREYFVSIWNEEVYLFAIGKHNPDDVDSTIEEGTQRYKMLDRKSQKAVQVAKEIRSYIVG